MFVGNLRNNSRRKQGTTPRPKFAIVSIALAILLLPTLACMSGEPSSTSASPIRSDIDQLAHEVRDLQQALSEMDKELQDVAASLTQIENNPPSEAVCNRSPAVQRAILQALSLAKCVDATNGELFRIESLELTSFKPFRAGDFSGLVNLSQLKMEISDTCGQWDNLTYTDSVLAQLPSLWNFDMHLYRQELFPDAASAEDIADAVFVSINKGIRTKSDEHFSESNQQRMEAFYRGGRVTARVYIEANENLYPCRGGTIY